MFRKWFANLAGQRKRRSTSKTGRRLRMEEMERRLVLSAPMAMDDFLDVHGEETMMVDVLLNDMDLDWDSLTISAVDTTGTLGTVQMDSSGQILYTPPAGFEGTDSFNYTVDDGFCGTDTAVVTVAQINFPPMAMDDFFETNGNTSVSMDPLGNDMDGDGDSLEVTEIDTASTQGTVNYDSETGMWDYTPPAGFLGADSFSYTIDDGHGGTSTATVTINVSSQIPQISNFFGVETGDGFWKFTGTVLDENPEGMIVTFGGLLDGHTTTVNADGTFELLVLFDPGVSGAATATTTDEFGQDSDEVETGVFPS